MLCVPAEFEHVPNGVTAQPVECTMRQQPLLRNQICPDGQTWMPWTVSPCRAFAGAPSTNVLSDALVKKVNVSNLCL